MTSPSALLFDLGGVVIDIDFERVCARWAAHAGCDGRDLRARFAVNRAYELHEVGRISDAEFFASLREALAIDITDDQFLEGWNQIFVGTMPGIDDLLARAARRLPLYAFSNTNPAHEVVWSRQFADTLAHFRKVFVSSTIGLRKPDAQAFQHVVDAIGVPAERILFFDDAQANIEGARACGLQTVHVRARQDVAAALAAIGV